MKFNELSTVIRAMLDTGNSIEILSAPGRGKSEFVAQTVANQSERDGQEWGFATLFLATQTPPDLIGYQFKGEREFNGQRVAITEPTLPAWMMTTDGRPVTDFERGILFLDEYGQGEADVKRASAELLLNRRLGPWALPRGWSVIAASNRAADRSGVTKSFDFVINRRIEIQITDDLDSWETWAQANKVDPLFITFARQNPQIVFQPGVPEKQGPWCTPRSLVMCANMLNGLAKARGATPEGNQWTAVPTDALANELASGLIGSGATAQLMAMIKLGQEMPSFEDIIKDPNGTKIPEKPDGKMLVMYSLAARVVAETAAAIIEYMERMPKEFAVSFAKAAISREPTLMRAKEFSTWASQNATLLASLLRSA